jgi:hypothetical protein
MSAAPPLRSFHGDPSIKAKYVAKLRAHHAADEIVQGSYWDDEARRGCAVGCAIEGSDHRRYEIILGLPEWLARLEDRIFEGLPAAEARDFARDFLEAIPVGSDLTRVRWRFQAALMEVNLAVVANLAIDDDLRKQVVDAIFAVLELNRRAIELGSLDESAAQSARSAAESATWSAEWSSAWAAAWAAASAAASAAAESASAAESAESAESVAYQRQAANLLDLLRTAEVPVSEPRRSRPARRPVPVLALAGVAS